MLAERRPVSPATAGRASEARLPEPGGFDAHTHLDIVGLPVDGVLAAAADAGIKRVVNVGLRPGFVPLGGVVCR